MSACLLALRVGLILTAPPADSACRTAPEAFAIVGEASIALLPGELKAIVDVDRENWYAAAAVLRTTYTAQPSTTENHFIAMDVLQAGSSATQADRRFPKSQTKWKRMFKEKGVDQGGRLPWVLIDAYRELAVAFERGDTEMILQRSAAILHLATDAAMPFNTTLDPQGRSAGNEIWQVSDASSLMVAHRSVWQRCQIETVKRLSDRFRYEVRVWPGRLQRNRDPNEAVWSALDSGFETLQQLLRIDRDLLDQLQTIDADTFLSSEASYYDALGRQAVPLLKSRLETAAILTAELITHAWEASRRTASRKSSSAAGAADSNPATSEPAEKVSFVGSRSSKVFHRPGCRHVKRIRPENLVRFPVASDPMKAGRKPCRTCSPVAQVAD